MTARSPLAAAFVTVAALGLLIPSAVPSAHAHHRGPTGGTYQVELICEGRPCPEASKRGDRWVMGQYGDRYTIRLHNRSAEWVEAVVTVDGRDVVNGGSGSYSNRGYLLRPWESIDIDGWRVSLSEVAAFRFTDVPDSYAGRVDGGRNAGVVGVAFFPERKRRAVRPRPVRPHYGGEGGLWDDEDVSPRKSASAGSEGRGDAAAAPQADAKRKRSRTRQNLGTQYGERHWSSVTEVDFERASSRPSKVVTVRYDDRSGLISRGVSPPPRRWTPSPQRVSDRFVPPPPDPFPGRW